MENKYSNLVRLIAENRKAMDYFKTLPDVVKSKLASNFSEQIDSVEALQSRAQQLLKDEGPF